MEVRIPTEPLCRLGVFCFDPGFKAGLAVVSLDEAEPQVVYLDAMKTDKSPKKKRILVSDDDHTRASALWHWWDKVAQQVEHPIAVCAEMGSGGQSARAVHVMAYGKSLISGFALHLGVPLISASPQACKKAATGRKNASKQEVWKAMMKRHTNLGWNRFPLYLLEHAADSCAVWEACKESTEIQMAMRFANG